LKATYEQARWKKEGKLAPLENTQSRRQQKSAPKTKEKNGYKEIQLRSSRPLARAPFAQQHQLRTHTHTNYTDEGKGKRWQRKEEIRELEENLGNKHEKS